MEVKAKEATTIQLPQNGAEHTESSIQKANVPSNDDKNWECDERIEASSKMTSMVPPSADRGPTAATPDQQRAAQVAARTQLARRKCLILATIAPDRGLCYRSSRAAVAARR